MFLQLYDEDASVRGVLCIIFREQSGSMENVFIDGYQKERMRVYFLAVTVALGSTALIVNACMFKDTPTRISPVHIAHLR